MHFKVIIRLGGMTNILSYKTYNMTHYLCHDKYMTHRIMTK